MSASLPSATITNIGDEDALLEQAFKSHLEILKAKVQGRALLRCAISYAWPVRPEESSCHIHERVLRMAEDLEYVGIHVMIDLLTGNGTTSFITAIPDWIRSCDVALLVGTRSYADRAADPSTLTHVEAKILAEKKENQEGSVIALLLDGAFANAFPPGYSGMMNADIRTLQKYLRDFPNTISKLLGLPLDDPDVLAYKDKAASLLSVHPQVPHIAASTRPLAQSQQETQAELHTKYLAARVVVLSAKFNLDQRRILDGKVAARTRAIDAYIQTETAQPVYTVPEDLTHGSQPLETHLHAFINNLEQQVLLLQAPKGSGKTWVCRYLATTAWQEKQWVPVFVDLTKLANLTENLVEQALSAKGLDNATAAQAQEEREFLVIIEGFDKCKMQINLYAREQLHRWRGKAVFTCCSSYLEGAPHPTYYFMPPGNHQLPNHHGLLVVAFTTQYSCAERQPESDPAITILSERIPSTLTPPLASPAVLLSASFEVSKVVPPVRTATAKQLCPLQPLAQIAAPHKANITQDEQKQGFLLLQHDIIRPLLYEFLAKIKKLAASRAGSSHSTHLKQAFISYAWPPEGAARTQLQARLLRVVDDMGMAGISVLLDIRCLSLGVNINQFMRSGIDTSDYILWIGAPPLKDRIVLKPDGTAANNATVEFVHIVEKLKGHPGSLLPLWFVGDTLGDAFPACSPVVGYADGNIQPHDFHVEKEYYHHLPILAASVLGILQSPEFTNLHNHYISEVAKQDALFTDNAICSRLSKEADVLEQRQKEAESEVLRLLATIPAQYLRDLEDADEAWHKALQTRVDCIREQSASIYTKLLAYYIPLKGGLKTHVPPEEYFDVMDHVHSFLANDSEKVLIIQGGAGAGKSTFARHLERELWPAVMEVGDKGWIIPLFISLPQVVDPYHNIVETVLFGYDLTSEDISKLKRTKKLVFLLDALDELPLEHVPQSGLVNTNQLLEWPNAKVIITCRNEYLSALEKRMGTTYQHHLSQGQVGVGEIYLMPFDDTQVTDYLKAYTSVGGEGEWRDWRSYKEQLDTVDGLKVLAQTPFILKLLVSILPQLRAKNTATKRLQTVKQSDVYREFTEQSFEREMWKQLSQGGVPLAEDRLTHCRELAERLAQHLFAAGTTQVTVPLMPAEAHLLRALPVHTKLTMEDNYAITFIHKSVQEYFTAGAWLNTLNSGNEVTVRKMLGARLAEKGVIQIVCGCISETHKVLLLQQVLASRQGASSIAASNAITVLNAAHFCFSGMDLSRIRISRANLDEMLADGTNFSHADLTAVSMDGAWLRDADLRYAVTEDSHALWEYACPIEKNRPTIHCVAGFEDKIISGSDDNTIQVRYMSTGEQVGGPITGHTDCVTSVAVFEGNIISGSKDRTVRVWDISTGQQVGGPITGHTDSVTSVAVFEGKIISGSDDKTVRVWDFSTGRPMGTPMIGHTSGVTSVTVYEGKIISGSVDTTVRVWDLSTGQQVGEPITGHSSRVTSVTVCEGKIISGGEDNTVRVWDLSTGQQVGEPFREPIGSVIVVAAFEGKIIYGSNQGYLRVWDMSSHQYIFATKLDGPIQTVSYCSPHQIVVGFKMDRLHLWQYDDTTKRLWLCSRNRTEKMNTWMLNCKITGAQGWVRSCAAHVFCAAPTDGVDKCITNGVCTLTETIVVHVQSWFYCYTCFGATSRGCCVSCATVCHAGHELSAQIYSEFSCDCPQLNCKLFKKTQGRYGKQLQQAAQGTFAWSTCTLF